jgi:phosphatidylserine/phosphatidylglycerophosphate/cardiolipin synthase-like enzyme
VGLPLQPDLRPWPAWQRRAGLLLALALAVLALGVAARGRAAPPRLLLSGAGAEESYLGTVARLIAGARERVWVAMFVVRSEGEDPPRALMQALADAAARGCRVQVALDRGRDWQTREPDGKHLAPAAWLDAHGVRVVLDELERTSHTKAVIVDSRRAVVGSHNWTRSALVANREASLLIDDPAVAARLERELAGIPGWDPAR